MQPISRSNLILRPQNSGCLPATNPFGSPSDVEQSFFPWLLEGVTLSSLYSSFSGGRGILCTVGYRHVGMLAGLIKILRMKLDSTVCQVNLLQRQRAVHIHPIGSDCLPSHMLGFVTSPVSCGIVLYIDG